MLLRDFERPSRVMVLAGRVRWAIIRRHWHIGVLDLR